MGAVKQSLIRQQEASRGLCAACEREKWTRFADEHYFETDIAAQDPKRDPTHREATDAEWWAWVLSGGRDES